MSEADTYPRLLRTARARWWQPLIGTLFAIFVVASGAVAVSLVVSLAADTMGGSTDASDPLDPDTPLGLLGTNLAIAMLAPAVALAVIVVHRQRVGWLVSVTGQVRWALLGRLLWPAALVVLVFVFGVGFFVPPDSDTGSLDIDVPPAGTLVALLLVIAVTTPLQAAAEEVGFRGYLTQAVSSWFARPAVGIVAGGLVSAVIFAAAHGNQDGWLYADRFVFGAVASWLALRSGGLEAPIALHVANNLVSLGVAAVTGSLSDSLTLSTLQWQFAVLDVAMMLAFAVVVERVVRRWCPATRRVLSGAAPVGYP